MTNHCEAVFVCELTEGDVLSDGRVVKEVVPTFGERVAIHFHTEAAFSYVIMKRDAVLRVWDRKPTEADFIANPVNWK